MKKFFQIVGIIVLMCASFIYTDSVQMVSKSSDKLLNEIKSKKDGYKENAIPPLINDDEITPGLNGKEVDITRSYEQMSKVGYFDDKLLVYKTLKLENTLDKNKDKYIVSLNGKNMISAFIFKVDENDDITKIVREFDKKGLKCTFFINSNYLERHHNQIIKLVQNGYTIGNLSNNGDYNDSDFVWIKTIITNIGGQKYNYCYASSKKSSILKMCSLHNSFTIKPKVLINKSPFLSVKKNLNPGSIISFEVNKELNTQIETILNYTQSRGYILKALEKGLKE